MNGSMWSAEEVGLLLDMYGRGLSAMAMSGKLKRDVRSIACKLSRLRESGAKIPYQGAGWKGDRRRPTKASARAAVLSPPSLSTPAPLSVPLPTQPAVVLKDPKTAACRALSAFGWGVRDLALAFDLSSGGIAALLEVASA